MLQTLVNGVSLPHDSILDLSGGQFKRPAAESGIFYVLFDRATDNVPKARSATWTELVNLLTTPAEREAKDGPAWSPAIYAPGTTRGTANVLAITALVYDLDHDAQEFLDHPPKALRNIAHVVYSTHSHTIDAPRVRVVIQLAESIPPADYAEAWARGAALVGDVDPKTKDISHIHYLPSHPPGVKGFSRVVKGDPLDWRTLPPAPSATPRTSPRTSEPSAETPGDLFANLATIYRALPLLSQQRCDDYSSSVGCVAVGMICHEVTGGDQRGLDAWDLFCQRSEKYTPNWPREKWSTFGKYTGARLRMGSLIDWAWEDSGVDLAGGGLVKHTEAIAPDPDRLAELEARVDQIETANADLQAINANLEARLYQASESLIAAERNRDNLLRVLANPTARKLAPVGYTILSMCEQQAERADDLGGIQFYANEIAEAVGVSTATVGNHAAELQTLGMLEVESIPDDRPKAEEWWTVSTYRPLVGSVNEFLEHLANLPRVKQPGRGPGRKGCPNHPDALIIRTTTQVDRCSKCHAMIGAPEVVVKKIRPAGARRIKSFSEASEPATDPTPAPINTCDSTRIRVPSIDAAAGADELGPSATPEIKSFSEPDYMQRLVADILRNQQAPPTWGEAAGGA